MTDYQIASVVFEGQAGQVSWRGVLMADDEAFQMFLTDDVASRLHDAAGRTIFEAHLRGLANTGFARDSLNAILAAEVPEHRDWAVGEAMAEAYLEREYDITWPWNMERDKRNPRASLPGADLVGFKNDGEDTLLALGEVKTSTDTNTPPNVMCGRSGMTHQIDNLANDLSLLCQLLKWLLPRCKGTALEASFNSAVGLFMGSGNKAISLFGILIRDTQPNELDFRARGRSLARRLQDPTSCNLLAIYLPCAITDLPSRVSGGGV
jgi:hypothetical protein